jgi:hypothetical protein
MEYNIGSLVKTINIIYDNIWLGDLKEAERITDSYLESLGDESKISDFESAAHKIRKKILEIRRSARKSDVKNKRAWVSEKLSEELIKEKIDPAANLFGVLIIQLLGLEKLINAAVKTIQQKTLEDFKGNRTDERITRKGERYAYALEYHIDRWETRAVVNRDIELLNLSKVRKIFDANNIRLEEAPGEQRALMLDFYSRDMYAQVIGLERYVQISIRMPRTESDETKVRRIVENILASLVA